MIDSALLYSILRTVVHWYCRSDRLSNSTAPDRVPVAQGTVGLRWCTGGTVPLGTGTRSGTVLSASCFLYEVVLISKLIVCT